MKYSLATLGLGAALVAPALGQNAPGTQIRGPIDGPAIPRPRMTQADIEGGVFSERDLRRRGLEMFTTSFNKFDGHGDGPVNAQDPGEFGGRPTTNGTWLRVNGLDSQTCQECHGILSNATVPPTLGLAGVAGIANTAFPFVTDFDIDDQDGDEIANVNGRLINPPFLFGAGGVELVGKEMTIELQARKAMAQANPNTVVPLVAKGVSFGTISYDDVADEFDTSNVQGIEPDLVVRPFGRKGSFTSIRQFDVDALQFHMGMQAEELVGTNVDADGDGVVNEVTIGELTTMHIFGINLERPRVSPSPTAAMGLQTFGQIGCINCHIPSLETETTLLPVAFPEVFEDPYANVFYSADLTASADFDLNNIGGVTVPLFSDLKRHNMGPDLAETTGDPDADPFFITPRLWGVGDTAPYLHDGRALTLRDAIMAHGGEALPQRNAFAALSGDVQSALLIFLDSLRTPKNPAKGINKPRRQ